MALVGKDFAPGRELESTTQAAAAWRSGALRRYTQAKVRAHHEGDGLSFDRGVQSRPIAARIILARRTSQISS